MYSLDRCVITVLLPLATSYHVSSANDGLACVPVLKMYAMAGSLPSARGRITAARPVSIGRGQMVCAAGIDGVLAVCVIVVVPGGLAEVLPAAVFDVVCALPETEPHAVWRIIRTTV